ncbi:MAG: threonine synthase [Clostridiales bacterium]|nr:threonine synthase [Clostridiales bacterium]
MLFISTRGAGGGISAHEAILRGIAGDGGLYVPERLPRVAPDFIAGLCGMGYAAAAAKIMKLFMDDFSDAEVAECAEAAYGGRNFDSAAVAPLRELGDGRTYVLELFHGPTGAFKDMALQMLPPLLSKCLGKAGSGAPREVAILVATSGDTGKAALEGFRDAPRARILVFYPEDGVSEIQKLQMVTQEGGNVHVAAVKGNFDDAQSGVKAIFSDAAAAERLGARGIGLSSANSINWGRLMPQIAYYFWAYAALLARSAARMGERVSFAVPTGNFGNILAGWYAKGMGLPISKLICASNVNNVLSDFIATGVYDRNRGFTPTMSPSMDILISSNLERLLFELSGRDAALVSGWMSDLARSGRYDVGARVRAAIAGTLRGGFATEGDTMAAIRLAFEKYGYLMDPHTAVALHVYGAMREGKAAAAGGRGSDGTDAASAADGADCVDCADAASAAEGASREEITVLVSTASPYKFAKDVYLSIAADSVVQIASAGGQIASDAGVPVAADGGGQIASDGGEAFGCAKAGGAGFRAAAAEPAVPIAQASPIVPAAGTEPAEPAEPAEPTEPTEPTEPAEPAEAEFRYVAMLESISRTARPKWLAELRGKPRRHFAVAAKDGMRDAALSLLLGE